MFRNVFDATKILCEFLVRYFRRRDTLVVEDWKARSGRALQKEIGASDILAEKVIEISVKRICFKLA
jgi:hypothetical protein